MFVNPSNSPMGWLSLFMLFWLIFILFNMINYYNFLPSTPKSKNLTQFMMKSMNWKW